jgi:hypothetical protein
VLRQLLSFLEQEMVVPSVLQLVQSLLLPEDLQILREFLW